MEELLVYAILFYEGLATAEEYGKRLDELFLQNPANEDLLYLEWERDIKKAVVYIRTHVDCNALDLEQFGRNLMEKLKPIYANSLDIKAFASQMYSLWRLCEGLSEGDHRDSSARQEITPCVHLLCEQRQGSRST